MRPRDSLLEAILALKAQDARISVNEIIAYLYVCENEGLSVQELAFVAGLTQSTASRSLRSLGRKGSDWAHPPAIGLVDAGHNCVDCHKLAEHIVPPDLNIEIFQETVVAHPVGDNVPKPGNPLRSIVVSPRNAHSGR